MGEFLLEGVVPLPMEEPGHRVAVAGGVGGVLVAAGGLVFVVGSRGDPAAGRSVPATT